MCLILPHDGPINGEVPVFARLWPAKVRVRVTTVTTGAVQSAILATAEYTLIPHNRTADQTLCHKITR